MDATNPDKTFFISDTHFGHKAIINHCARPFADRDEMDIEMIKRWNATVPKDGTVYHMGDISFRSKTDTQRIIALLHGTIRLIKGNHDHGKLLWSPNIEKICDYAEVKLDGQFIIMCHYPMESWNQMHHGSWHLHGHSHGNIPDFGKRMDMGVDCHGTFAPMPYATLKAAMALRPVESRDHHQPDLVKTKATN